MEEEMEINQGGWVRTYLDVVLEELKGNQVLLQNLKVGLFGRDELAADLLWVLSKVALNEEAEAEIMEALDEWGSDYLWGQLQKEAKDIVVDSAAEDGLAADGVSAAKKPQSEVGPETGQLVYGPLAMLEARRGLLERFLRTDSQSSAVSSPTQHLERSLLRLRSLAQIPPVDAQDLVSRGVAEALTRARDGFKRQPMLVQRDALVRSLNAAAATASLGCADEDGPLLQSEADERDRQRAEMAVGGMMLAGLLDDPRDICSVCPVLHRFETVTATGGRSAAYVQRLGALVRLNVGLGEAGQGARAGATSLYAHPLLLLPFANHLFATPRDCLAEAAKSDAGFSTTVVLLARLSLLVLVKLPELQPMVLKREAGVSMSGLLSQRWQEVLELLQFSKASLLGLPVANADDATSSGILAWVLTEATIPELQSWESNLLNPGSNE